MGTTWYRNDQDPKQMRNGDAPLHNPQVRQLGPDTTVLVSLHFMRNDGGSSLLLLARQLVPPGLPRGQHVLGSLRSGGRDGGKCIPSSRQEHASRR